MQMISAIKNKLFDTLPTKLQIKQVSEQTGIYQHLAHVTANPMR